MRQEKQRTISEIIICSHANFSDGAVLRMVRIDYTIVDKKIPSILEATRNSAIVDPMNIGIYLNPSFTLPFLMVAMMIEEKNEVTQSMIMQNQKKPDIEIPSAERLPKRLPKPPLVTDSFGSSILVMMPLMTISRL